MPMQLTNDSGLVKAMRQDRERDLLREDVVRRAYDALPGDCRTCPQLDNCAQPTTALYQLARNIQYKS